MRARRWNRTPALLPDGTLAGLDALLAEFARRRVRIALYGEVKAGKSTLLNAIAGAALSPVAFEPLTSIPVRVTYGERTTWRIGDRRLDSLAELERLMRESSGRRRHSATRREVVVETDLDLLELGGQVDLLDTPGVGSAPQFDAVSADVAALTRRGGLGGPLPRVVYAVHASAHGRLAGRHRQAVRGVEPRCRLRRADAGRTDPPRRDAADQRRRRPRAVSGRRARRVSRHAEPTTAAASVASGLTALIAALRRFASSGRREVTALREAAKRTHHSLAWRIAA